MKVVITFLENVLQPEMEEEFVKLTEVVLKFELKKVFNFKQLSFFGSCFFLELFTSSVRYRSSPAIHYNLICRTPPQKDFNYYQG